MEQKATEPQKREKIEVSKKWKPAERLAVVGLIASDLITSDFHPRPVNEHLGLVDLLDKLVYARSEFLETNRANYAKYIATPSE